MRGRPRELVKRPDRSTVESISTNVAGTYPHEARLPTFKERQRSTSMDDRGPGPALRRQPRRAPTGSADPKLTKDILASCPPPFPSAPRSRRGGFF